MMLRLGVKPLIFLQVAIRLDREKKGLVNGYTTTC
jgi:hypothetical protein